MGQCTKVSQETMSADDSVRNVDNGDCEEDDNEECAVMDVGHMTRTEYSEDFDSDGDTQRKTIMMKKTLVTAIMTAVVMIFRFWRPVLNSHSSDRSEMLDQKPNFCVASLVQSHCA